MLAEDSLRDGLQATAAQRYGEQRASELAKRIGEIAHWLALVDQQPLDLLDEEPDSGRSLPRPSQRERVGVREPGVQHASELNADER